MTASNHAATGALVAVAVSQPYIAVPLALAAHFAMDGIPHFGLGRGLGILERNRSKVFVQVLLADVLLF